MRDKQCIGANLAGRCEGRRRTTIRWRMLCEAAAIEQRPICSIRKTDPLSHRVKPSASDARNEIAHVASNASEAASNGAIGHQHITEATREARKRRALDALHLVERYRFTYMENRTGFNLGLIGPMPLQFFKFSDLPLQLIYCEICHYKSLST